MTSYLVSEPGSLGRPYLMKDLDAEPTAAQRATVLRVASERGVPCASAWVIADGTGNLDGT